MNIAIPIQPTEQELILACVERQTWAQQRIYEDNYRIMMAVCLRYSNSSDDAFDILHEGFLKVFMNIKSYEPGTMLQAWIRRIMVNTAIDFYRKESRRVTRDLEEAKTMSYSKSGPIEAITVQEVMKAVQGVEGPHRPHVAHQQKPVGHHAQRQRTGHALHLPATVQRQKTQGPGPGIKRKVEVGALGRIVAQKR